MEKLRNLLAFKFAKMRAAWWQEVALERYMQNGITREVAQTMVPYYVPENLTLGEKDACVYFAMADECIRQMEWATREGRDFESLDILDKPKLTIAPDDWKPE